MSLFARVAKTASRTMVRQFHVEQKGIPGANLPFDINNHVKLTLWFTIYFASGFAVPFIALRHHLLKS